MPPAPRAADRLADAPGRCRHPDRWRHAHAQSRAEGEQNQAEQLLYNAEDQSIPVGAGRRGSDPGALCVIEHSGRDALVDRRPRRRSMPIVSTAARGNPLPARPLMQCVMLPTMLAGHGVRAWRHAQDRRRSRPVSRSALPRTGAAPSRIQRIAWRPRPRSRAPPRAWHGVGIVAAPVSSIGLWRHQGLCRFGCTARYGRNTQRVVTRNRARRAYGLVL